jgi:hypothetical protein
MEGEMTKNDAVYTVMNGIMFGNSNIRRFVDALKILSKEEIDKVSQAIDKRTKSISSFAQKGVQNEKETAKA